MTTGHENSSLAFADLERVYEALAEAIDKVGPEREALMLARLALLLANDDGIVERVLTRIGEAVATTAHDACKFDRN
jgi:hypothetical protein